MKIEYNKKRDIILYEIIPDWDATSLQRFENINVLQLRELVKLEQAVLSSRHNDSPTIEEFILFMEKYPNTTAHGFAKAPQAKETISVEGIEYKGEYNKEQLRDFINLCRHADEFIVEDNILYCWFD